MTLARAPRERPAAKVYHAGTGRGDDDECRQEELDAHVASRISVRTWYVEAMSIGDAAFIMSSPYDRSRALREAAGERFPPLF